MANKGKLTYESVDFTTTQRAKPTATFGGGFVNGQNWPGQQPLTTRAQVRPKPNT